MESDFKDTIEGHPQTITTKLRRRLLFRSGLAPGIIGKQAERNLGLLTRQKAMTISDTEKVTGRKLDWQTPKEGD